MQAKVEVDRLLQMTQCAKKFVLLQLYMHFKGKIVICYHRIRVYISFTILVLHYGTVTSIMEFGFENL